MTWEFSGGICNREVCAHGAGVTISRTCVLHPNTLYFEGQKLTRASKGQHCFIAKLDGREQRHSTAAWHCVVTHSHQCCRMFCCNRPPSVSRQRGKKGC